MHLYTVLFAKNIRFDPLGMFTDDEERVKSQTPAEEEDEVEQGPGVLMHLAIPEQTTRESTILKRSFLHFRLRITPQ